MDCEIVAGCERSVLLDSGGFAEQKDCRCRFVTIAQGANDSHMGGSQEGEIKNPSKKVGENKFLNLSFFFQFFNFINIGVTK